MSDMSVARRIIFAGVASTIAIPICEILGLPSAVVVLVFAILATSAYVGKGIGPLLASATCSVAATAVVIWAISLIAPSVIFDARLVLITAMLLSAVILGKWFRKIQIAVSTSAVLTIVAICVPLQLIFRSLPHDSFVAITKLVESSTTVKSTWVRLLVAATRSSESVNTPLATQLGESTVRALARMVQATTEWGAPTILPSANGLMLIQIFALCCVVAVVFAVLITDLSMKKSNAGIRFIGSFVSGLTMLLMMSELFRVGALMGAIVAPMALAGFWLVLVSTVTIETRAIAIAGTIVLVIAALQSPYLTTAVAICALGCLVRLVIASGQELSFPFDLSKRKVLISLIGAELLSIVVLFGDFFQNNPVSRLRDGMLVTGDNLAVGSLLAVVILGLTFWAVSSNMLVESQTSARTVLYGMIFLPVIAALVLFAISYTTAPYAPQFAAWELLFLAVAVCLPIAIGVSSAWLGERTTDIFGVSLIGALYLLCYVFLGGPVGYFNWMNGQVENQPQWLSTVIEQVDKGEPGTLVCLNTVSGNADFDADSFNCTTVALALQGKSDGESTAWAMANRCALTSDQAKKSWSTDFFDQLTVLALDSSHYSSSVSCQAGPSDSPMGWLTFVDYSRITLIDFDGNPITVDVNGISQLQRG